MRMLMAYGLTSGIPLKLAVDQKPDYIIIMNTKYPISVEFPVHWGELDALGHVNHARFLVWMESARMAFFETVGLHWQNQPTQGPILANLEVNYRAPVNYPAQICCRVGVGRIGTTSFLLEYVIEVVGESENMVADGRTIIVLYDYERGMKTAIPDQMRAILENLNGKNRV